MSIKNNNFELKILDLHWLAGADEQTDLCAHRILYIKIGDEVVCDADSLEITLSSTALYLLRTLTDNYKKDDYASQLLPCCGHVFMADEQNGGVSIMGCPNGIDWTIKHLDNNFIEHTTESGAKALISFDDYKSKVLDFADKVEAFYTTSLPKILPDDEFDRNGYFAFWKEWRKLRDVWN